MPHTASGASTSSVELDLERHRDLRGRSAHPSVRRIVLALLALVVVIALLDGFGQGERVATAQNTTARVDLRTPSVLRGGLMWRARVTVRARTRIVDPQLVLGAGYASGMQLNTIEPAATDEASRGDSLALSYATLEPGDELTVYLQLQVDPSTAGRQDLSVVLQPGGDDRPAPVRLGASVTVLP